MSGEGGRELSNGRQQSLGCALLFLALALIAGVAFWSWLGPLSFRELKILGAAAVYAFLWDEAGELYFKERFRRALFGP